MAAGLPHAVLHTEALPEDPQTTGAGILRAAQCNPSEAQPPGSVAPARRTNQTPATLEMKYLHKLAAGSDADIAEVSGPSGAGVQVSALIGRRIGLFDVGGREPVPSQCRAMPHKQDSRTRGGLTQGGEPAGGSPSPASEERSSSCSHTSQGSGDGGPPTAGAQQGEASGASGLNTCYCRANRCSHVGKSTKRVSLHVVPNVLIITIERID
ncbi:unnamed protein product [Lampetra planeri]